mgnify:FL=1
MVGNGNSAPGSGLVPGSGFRQGFRRSVVPLGIFIAYLELQENGGKEKEYECLDKADQQFNGQERKYAQGASQGAEHVGHRFNDRLTGVNVSEQTGGQRNGPDGNACLLYTSDAADE